MNLPSDQGVSTAPEDAEALAKEPKYQRARGPENGRLVACKQFHGFRKQRAVKIAEYGQANTYKKRNGTFIWQITLFIAVRLLSMYFFPMLTTCDSTNVVVSAF